MPRFGPCAAALLVLLVAGAARSVAAAPSPVCGIFRNGWAMAPAADGETRELYWELQDYTEKWVTITPAQRKLGQQGVPTLRFVFSVCFKGRTMPLPQPMLEIRVQIDSHPLAAMVSEPKVELVLDAGTVVHLTGGPFRHVTEYGSCEGGPCPPVAALVEVPVSVVDDWLRSSRTISGLVSGTPFELSVEHLAGVRRFLDHVTGR